MYCFIISSNASSPTSNIFTKIFLPLEEPAHLVNFAVPDIAPIPAAILILPIFPIPSPPSLISKAIALACENDLFSNNIFSPIIEAYSVTAPNIIPGIPCFPFGST